MADLSVHVQLAYKSKTLDRFSNGRRLSMADYRQAIREHLAASRKRLEKGTLSDGAAEVLRRKIRGLSALLREKRGI